MGTGKRRSVARGIYRALEPLRPDKTGYKTISSGKPHEIGSHFQIDFDAAHGAITHLANKNTGRRWASPKNLLALFCYQTFSQADYDRFYRQYIINKRKTAHWSVDDYTKPGMEAAGQQSGLWNMKLAGLYRSGSRVLVELVPPKTVTWGCPRFVTLEYEFSETEPATNLTVQWFDKPASRLPEALWLSFNPIVARAVVWRMQKMGLDIWPGEVIRQGNRKLHAVENVRYDDGQSRFSIDTLDAPLVAPGEPSLLNFNSHLPPLSKGMHFNLYNNIWGTNFPMWYDDDARFRFNLHL